MHDHGSNKPDSEIGCHKIFLGHAIRVIDNFVDLNNLMNPQFSCCWSMSPSKYNLIVLENIPHPQPWEGYYIRSLPPPLPNLPSLS